MVLAAEALAEHGTLGQFTVDGGAVKGALNRRFAASALSAKPVAIANAGEAAVQLVTTISGSPIAPEPEASHGYAVERTIWSLDGKKLDVKASPRTSGSWWR